MVLTRNLELFARPTGLVSLLLLLALAAWPVSALAQGPAEAATEAEAEAAALSPQEVALAASTARDLYCTDVAGVDVALQSRALGTVNEVWTQVIEVHTRTKESFLLYWRGVLAQCLDQEFRAAQDLNAFVAAHGDDTSLGPMLLDAQRRLRLLQNQTSAAAQAAADRGIRKKASFALGIGLGATSVGFAGLALWQRAEMDSTAAAMTSGVQGHYAQNEYYRQGAAQATNATAFLSLAAGMAIGSLTSFLWSAAEGRAGSGPRARPQLSLAALPHPRGGAAARLELTW